MSSRPALALVSLLLAAGAVLGADRLAGALLPHPELQRGLIFPPHAALTYELHELTFTTRINAFGLRDREISERAPAGRLRVVALGDSFTFGWGVELEQAWIKRCEAALRARGHDVEILNLGAPGASPPDYAELAERAVPALRPDLVLVGLLQGDDLRQCDPDWVVRSLAAEAAASATAQASGPSTSSALQRGAAGLARWIPNLVRLAARDETSAAADQRDPLGMGARVRATWSSEAAELRARLNPAQAQRYAALPAAWRAAYEDGRVPLWAMQRLFLEPRNPDYERQLDSPQMQRRIEIAARYLARVKSVAVAHGAEVLVLSIPSAAYSHPARFSGLSDIGTDEELLTNIPDRAAALACSTAGLPMKEVTAAFRRRAAREPLFFDVDAHFTAEGNRVFAELVTPWVERSLPRR